MNIKSKIRIRQASGPTELDAVRTLFKEYATWLKVDLCFQGFSQELAELPGNYAPPRGRLLLACVDEELAGCVALRPLEDQICEMKRLFVRPQFRRHGIGQLLTKKVISEARITGYERMRLDTLEHMTPAIRLYESIGFQSIPAYYKTPLLDTVFMELVL